ncbi:MAG: glucosaminidase domain-containing protein [Sulfurovum sp.]|jgi:Bax protein
MYILKLPIILSFLLSITFASEATVNWNNHLIKEEKEVHIKGQPALENGGLPKEYYEITSTSKAKKYFFDYLYKLIEKENIAILNERKIVLEFSKQNLLNFNFSSPNFKKYQRILKKYKVKYLYDTSNILKKVDIVPPSQAIAQAAVESGWGKSRFIKEANNIFGHWTYTPDIGLMPLQRDDDAKHFIRIFPSLQASVSAYMLNLNRNAAYKEFQNKRFELRRENKPLSGRILSQTMLKYSGIGHNYLEILDTVIQSNGLNRFDTKFFNKTKGL